MCRHEAKVVFSMLTAIAVLVWSSCRKDLPEINPAETSGRVYPGQSWRKIGRPEELGWSSAKLTEARRYARKIDSAAVMIVDGGIVVDAWGDITRNFRCHSMRKSLLSGLMGTYVSAGTVDLSKSLAELGINDYPQQLSETEKQATVGDLIKARSGIYIEALGESPDMKARRPERHSHPPGTFWYYNNWDFNALGTIFEKETGENLFEAFDRRLAQPLQMQDFDPANCRYQNNCDYGTPGLSMHRYYDIRMSARDLARFGLLFLREGRWKGNPILPQQWVWESTAGHSRVGSNSGYGYMWWTGTETGLLPNVRVKGHCYAAAGWGGHFLIVLPWRNLVIVHRVNTDNPGDSVANHQIGRLLWHILDAAGEAYIGPRPTMEAGGSVPLSEGQMAILLPGSAIRGVDFRVELTPDRRFALWSGGKQLDTGHWNIRAGRFWIKSPLVTGDREVGLKLVLDGDRLSWYDRQGTLVGSGIFKRREVSYEKDSIDHHFGTGAGSGRVLYRHPGRRQIARFGADPGAGADRFEKGARLRGDHP